jgi:hypothetical protein
LNDEPSYIKRKQISKPELIIDTIQIDRKNNGKNQQDQHESLLCPMFILKNKMNDYQRKKCVQPEPEKIA